jgi:hypothetical protein
MFRPFPSALTPRAPLCTCAAFFKAGASPTSFGLAEPSAAEPTASPMACAPNEPVSPPAHGASPRKRPADTSPTRPKAARVGSL